MNDRRHYPTLPLERTPLLPPIDNDHKRGHVAASMGARIPSGASLEYRRGWRAGVLDRYCTESAGGAP